MMHLYQVWSLEDILTSEQWDIILESVSFAVDHGYLPDNLLVEAQGMVNLMQERQ